jgi:hypothetical protein
MPYFSPKPWICRGPASAARAGSPALSRPEVLVALAELLDRGLLVRVAHEVDVALEDLRVELDGLLDRLPVSPPVLVASMCMNALL